MHSAETSRVDAVSANRRMRVLAPPRFALGCSPRLRPSLEVAPLLGVARETGSPNRVERESVPYALVGDRHTPSALNAQEKQTKE